MDKFGFFNLLNSFFPQNTQTEQKPDQKNANSPDFLTNLFSNLNTQNQPTSSPTQPKESSSSPEKQAKPFAPLQQNMLSTMTNHDNFVKRVKEKHKS